METLKKEREWKEVLDTLVIRRHSKTLRNGGQLEGGFATWNKLDAEDFHS